MFRLMNAVGLIYTIAAGFWQLSVDAFSLSQRAQSNWGLCDASASRRRLIIQYAGGFEWEDPDVFGEPDVENPFKKYGDEAQVQVDAARLLSPRLQGSNLYFVGIMGSGKSAVGDIVARRLGNYNFLDTDVIIESAAGMSIPKIFAEAGEDVFRDIESQVLNQVHAYVRCVISTGGGIVCRPMNWSKLHTGIVVWLDVEPEVIMSRIEGTDRPLLQTENPLETLTNLLDQRTSRYQQADVHVKVTPDMSEHDVADSIIKELHDFIDNNPPAWKMAKEKAKADGLDWVE